MKSLQERIEITRAILEKEFQARLNTLAATAEVYEKCALQGLQLSAHEENELTEFHSLTLPKDLAIVRKIVGKLETENVIPYTDEWVIMYFRPIDDKYRHLKFTLHRQMPSTGKCKITKIQKESYELVCEK